MCCWQKREEIRNGGKARGIRRPVSISTMRLAGSYISETSPLSEYSKENQKSPTLPSHSSKHPSRQLVEPPSIDIEAMLAKTTQPSEFSQYSPDVKNSEKPQPALHSSGWNKSEGKCIGLGVVATNFSNGTDSSTRAKDGENEATPPIESKNIVASKPTHGNIDMQRPSAIFLHEWTCNDDCDDFFCMIPPTASFLEACYLCKRKLSLGRDIYMYRGDQAFCSEECRHEQISLDERQEMRGLQAIKMRTSVSPVQSSDQRRGRLTPDAAVAG